MKYCPQCASQLVQKEIDGAPKMHCQLPGCRFVHWNNPVPVVAALVNHEGKIILAQNTSWPKGLYSMITGYLDEKEIPEQGVIREVREELNLEVHELSFIGHYLFAEKNQLIIAFAVTASGQLKLNEELADLRRLSVEELQAYDFAPMTITQSIVNDWLEKRNTL